MRKSVAMVHLSKKSYKNTRTIIKPSGMFLLDGFSLLFPYCWRKLPGNMTKKLSEISFVYSYEQPSLV